MRLKEIKVGDYLDSISDYHANGSYKNLKKNITFKKKKRLCCCNSNIKF